MAIAASDINFRYSVKTGAAGNSTAGTASGSLGKWISTTEVTTAKNDLFDNISGAENASSTVDYRCVFVHNGHASLDYQNSGGYVASEVAGGASVTLAVDNIGQTVISYDSNAQADEITNETTAPTGVGAFSAPTTPATALSMGTIPAGACRAIWVKRTAANTSALTDDGFTLGVTGDSAA